MNTRSPARQQRATDRAQRRASFRVLLDRLDRLTPAEQTLLRETALAELAEAEQVTRARRGLDQARDRLQRRLDAADRAIVEAEQDLQRVSESAARWQAAYRNAQRRALAATDRAKTAEAAVEAQRRRGDSWRRHANAEDDRADRNYAAWRSARRRARTTEATLAHIRTPRAVSSGHPMYALLDAMIGPGIDQATAREHVGEYFRAITQQEPTP
ncbi:hypothetical protein ACFY8P_35330 [Streptomyces sp. NPDC012693]|uniref:hypothetical protein n=1 Tax=Streptomyces sp. NPDC012693 TaxID=3364844 RepID=UPI0036A6F57A